MGLCRSLEINMLFRKGKEGSNGFYTCRCFYFFLPNNTPNANSSKCLLLNQVQRPKIGEGLRSQYYGGDCARVDNHKTFSLQIQTLCETFRLIKDVIVLLLASLPLYTYNLLLSCLSIFTPVSPMSFFFFWSLNIKHKYIMAIKFIICISSNCL